MNWLGCRVTDQRSEVKVPASVSIYSSTLCVYRLITNPFAFAKDERLHRRFTIIGSLYCCRKKL